MSVEWKWLEAEGNGPGGPISLRGGHGLLVVCRIAEAVSEGLTFRIPGKDGCCGSSRNFAEGDVRTGRQTIAGPYVDYLGFNEYIVTCTVPSYVHGTFIGVTGCDLRVRDLEKVFIPMIRTVPGDAAILNGNEDRVVLGNSGRFLVGERIKNRPEGYSMVPLEVPYLNLGLLCRTAG